MRIQNNITAVNAHRNYGINNAAIAKSVEKLSSGYRINRAGDDAAGLAISEKMRAQIRGLTMASKNSQDAVSLIQTAEGALQESHNILQRMRELAVQSASDTNQTQVDRDALNQEYQQLIQEIDDTADKTVFNNRRLINGDFASAITSAVSTNTNFGVAWSKTGNVVGTYTISVTAVIDKAAIASATGSGTTNGIDVTITTGVGAFSATYNTGTVNHERLNGVWKLSMQDGLATLTNINTGEVSQTQLIGASAGQSVALDFKELGSFTFQIGNSDLNADDYSAISGEISISGAVDEQAVTYKHIATLGDDEVLLETGQKTLNFVNSGISVKLTDALVVNHTDSTTMTAAAGEIVVSELAGQSLTIQSGANEGDNVKINLSNMNAYALGIKSSGIGNRLDASVAITQVNTAVNLVSTQRAALGALQNRLEHKMANLDTSAENLQAAESRIRDVDMAKEMTTFMKNNILGQASTAMLAQANSLPQGVLQLLG
jgi:flagellin